MAGAGLSILGTKLIIRKLISIAVIYGLFVYFVRQAYILLKIPLGTHAFILMIIFAFLLILIGKVHALTAFIASLTSVLLVLWGEGVFLYPALLILKIDIISLVNSELGYTVLAILISDILLIIGFIFGYVFNISLITFDREKVQISAKE